MAEQAAVALVPAESDTAGIGLWVVNTVVGAALGGALGVGTSTGDWDAPVSKALQALSMNPVNKMRLTERTVIPVSEVPRWK
jgi:hypothetical protein